MLLDRDNITRRYIDEYISLNNIHVNNLLEVTTMDLLIEFAKIGLGVGSVIKEFVKEDLDAGQLDIPIHKRTVGFIYYPSRSSNALEAFVRFVKH